MMDAAVQDVLFYITAGLCTFLALLMSYRWLLRKPQKAQEEEEKMETSVTKISDISEDDAPVAETTTTTGNLIIDSDFGPWGIYFKF